MREILIDSVFRAFGSNEVLRGSSLRLKTGKVTGLLGRNGCGKSTLLKILIGEQAADNAYIGVDGVFRKHLYQDKHLINYLPQHLCHPKAVKIGRLVELYGLERERFFSTFGDVFPDPDVALGSFSGGQGRLFEVLTVLQAPSDFTLLDEPFSHIMPVHVNRVKKMIRQAAQHKGVLITDHQYRHVLELADTLYLMHSGTTSIVSDQEDLVRLGYIKRLD